ncbi:hypothetical protein ACFW9N_42070 [Streptomyces sp. NPDC059496]|uniref:hypothetical protein n=1 Tax=Streptomyces sp. NPDC059496 TaxID=3346851 RepID=UPI00369F49E0
MPATAEGEALFVGRDAVAKKLANRLTSSDLHPTIEGENGVGKTSLVSVVGYRLRRDYEDGQTSQAIIPLTEAFQLTSKDTAAALERKVLLAVAAAMINHHDLLKRGGHDVPDVSDVERWLNSPLLTGGGGGATALGFGGTVTRTVSANTGAGFNEEGLRSTISGWLSQCFPTSQSGAFVCVLDNLELLETSKDARALLESMRDGMLSLRGLKWVLCGARGIVRTSASSPRLEGRLAEPLELDPIADDEISQVIARRLEYYRLNDSAAAPVGPESFKLIYDILNKNLRNALKYSEDFSFWLYDEGYADRGEGAFGPMLEQWIKQKAEKSAEQTDLSGTRAWEVFDALVAKGGNCSPGDFEEFGFNSPQAMVPHIKTLEDANLVQSSTSDEDRRRKTITVTPRGWLVRYARSGYLLPE